MMREIGSDSHGLDELVWSALEFLPDELFLVSIVIGMVFGLIWLIRELFRMSFNP